MKYSYSILVVLYSLFSLPDFAQRTKNLGTIDKYIISNKSKLYYHQKGMGKIPVVFVSGLGEDHNTWQIVQDSVSGFALTISYDRSGLGQSEYTNKKKDLLSMTTELKNLIKHTMLPKPLILVGHSLGSQIVKQYAALYPENIKAIVFIDPGYNEDLLKARVSDSLWQKREITLKKYMPEFNIAQKEELRHLNRDAAISDSIKLNSKIPILLFTATKISPGFPCSAEELAVKKESHNLWLKTMPKAIHTFVPQSRHYIQNEMPDLIITGIRSML